MPSMTFSTAGLRSLQQLVRGISKKTGHRIELSDDDVLYNVAKALFAQDNNAWNTQFKQILNDTDLSSSQYQKIQALLSGGELNTPSAVIKNDTKEGLYRGQKMMVEQNAKSDTEISHTPPPLKEGMAYRGQSKAKKEQVENKNKASEKPRLLYRGH